MKKNIRKIPKSILAKLSKIDATEIEACCSVEIHMDRILAGEFGHLGILIEDGELVFPDKKVPESTQGKFSRWNVEGKECKRKDLPKETFYTHVELPNWGDYSKGTHTVSVPRERYPVDFLPPRKVALRIELLNEGSSSDIYLFRFVASEVLSRKDPRFHDRLFGSLNLLQENLGGCDVARSGLSQEEYLATHRIAWEILPPGNKGEVMVRLFSGRMYTSEEKAVAEDRYDFLLSLGAKGLIVGDTGLDRYFGARLADNLVVFENIEYGNAMYVMYDNWEQLSRKSRVELLTGRYGREFDRVVHHGAWQDKVRDLIRTKMAG